MTGAEPEDTCDGPSLLFQERDAGGSHCCCRPRASRCRRSRT
jgi:hypothetical protein